MIQFILCILGLLTITFLAFVFGAVAALVWVCQLIEEARGKNEMRNFIDFIKRD